MLNWSDFEVIVAIKNAKTLSAAAKTLGVNQSTISRCLKRIESDLGQQIFLNKTGNYELTPEGIPFFNAGKAMEQSIMELERSTPQSVIQGVVRVSTVEVLVNYLLDRIDGFREKFPHVSIELNGSNENVHLPRRNFDSALRLCREEGFQ